NVSVTGAPAPLNLDNPLTQVCKGQTGVTYSLTAANPGSIYSWTVIGGTIVGASSAPNLHTITVNWGSSAVDPPSVSVEEQNGNGCLGDPRTVFVTLNDV